MLPFFIAAVQNVMLSLSAHTYELILIDDGSTDGTLSVIKSCACDDDRVKFVSFTRNFGKEAAMLAGLRCSVGDVVCLIDVDLQDPPELIKYMLDDIGNGFDMVVARRVRRKGAMRSIFASLFYRTFNGMARDVQLADGERDFRMITRTVANKVMSFAEHNRFSKGLFNWLGYKSKFICYDDIRREKSTSKWSFSGLARYAIGAFTDFSDLPLKMISYLGLALFVTSLYCLVRSCGAAGDKFVIMFAVLFSGSLVIFSIGIVGAYIAKIHAEVKMRPYYIVRDSNVDSYKRGEYDEKQG